MISTVRQIFGVTDALYYHTGTETAVIAMSIMLLFCISFMGVKKTKGYVRVSSGIFLSCMIAFLDIVLAFVSQYGYADMNMLVFIILSIASTMHILSMCHAFNYVVLLSSVERSKKWHLAIMIYGLLSAFTIDACYFIKGPVRNIYGVMDLSLYRYFTVGTCIIICIMAYVYVKFHRKSYTYLAVKVLRAFVALYFILCILQMLMLRTIMTALLSFIPIAGIYIIFHAVPFDYELGSQDESALDLRFNKDLSGKVFTYIRFNHDTEDIKPILTRLVERMDAYDKYISVYAISSTEFVLLHNIHDRDIYETVLNDDFVPQFMKMNVAGFVLTDEITSSNMALFLARSVIKRFTGKQGKCKHFLSEEEFNDMLFRFYIGKHLISLRDNMTYSNNNVLCYAQPIYEVHSKKFKTAESLMRFVYEGEVVSPEIFIPIAEDNHCIHFLTMCMLHRVCQAIVSLMETCDFDAISVNVSVQEFSEKLVAYEFLSVIDTYRIPHDKIRIELTESILETDSNILMENMKVLKDAGIVFYLDDFGTGYSSMDRLMKFPFSVVKFDKSLLHGAMDYEKTDNLVKGIIPIFRKDEYVSLIEGVETDDQYDYSVNAGFEYIQGFKFSKPVPIMELTSYFVEKSL